MNTKTFDQLRSMESFPWFANAGQPLAGEYVPIENWNRAVESSAGEIWSSVQLQVKNRLAREVRQKNYDRSEEWNGIADEVAKALATIMAESSKPVTKKFGLNPNFEGSLSWDLLMICMEAEFSDLVSPIFFIPRLRSIYEAGHFPCGWLGPKLNEGWEGELPNWQLIVY